MQKIVYVSLMSEKEERKEKTKPNKQLKNRPRPSVPFFKCPLWIL